MQARRYLGLDLSTQSLTAVVIEPCSGEIRQFSIPFDERYPQFGTRGGVLPSEDPLRAHVDPLMWAAALEDMLLTLKAEGLTREVAAVAVSAQQHGTVYLNAQAGPRLAALKPAKALHEALAGVFSRATSPIWMDSSTGRECDEITQAIGGDAAVARLTGSVATERFAGPQIRRFWKEDPAAYGRTAHIALISSFLTSLLAGRLAPVDAGDGYGTNLADIRAGAWSEAAMAVAAPGLAQRLPRLAERDGMLGRVSAYLCARFGFRPETAVVVGSGDNPSSLAGLGLIGDTRTRAVSLGTSDTFFGYMPELAENGRTEGHVFGSADGRYMFLVCFKNGSLAREKIKNDHGLSWTAFSDILRETPAGNHGRILLPYFQAEITPRVLEAGARRYGGLAADDARGNVRAVAEAQAMSMFLHSGWTGARPETLLVTAGGSENLGLLTVIAQVFGSEVRSLEIKDSAALGAALRAAHAWLNRQEAAIDWQELSRFAVAGGAGRMVRPSPEAVRVYRGKHGLIDVYAACERFALGKGPDPAQAFDDFRRVYGW